MENRNVRQRGESGLHLRGDNVLPPARMQPAVGSGEKEGDCTRYAAATTLEIWQRKQQLDEFVPEDELMPYLSTEQIFHLNGTPYAHELLQSLHGCPITTDEVYMEIDRDFLEGRRANREIPEGAPSVTLAYIDSFLPGGQSSDWSDDGYLDERELYDYQHEELSNILQNGGCFVGTLQYDKNEAGLISTAIYKRGQDYYYEEGKHEYHSVCVVGEGGMGPDAYYVYLNSYGPHFGENGLGRINKRFLIEAFYIKHMLNNF